MALLKHGMYDLSLTFFCIFQMKQVFSLSNGVVFRRGYLKDQLANPAP
jgi:hypothetical protein